MHAADIVYHLVWDIAPVALLFCLLIAAFLLWSRTHRASTMAQVIGTALVFIGHGLFKLRWLPHVAIARDTSLMYVHALRSRLMEIVMMLAPLLGLMTFAIGYLVYATSQKRT